MTDAYAYDAWGNLTARTGTTDQPYQYVGRFGYYTHWQDANLALLQLGVRFYDLETGRFTQPDQIISNPVMASFAYVGANPLNWVDPGGLAKGAPTRDKCLEWLRKIQELTDKLDRHYNKDKCCGGPDKGHWEEEWQYYKELKKLWDKYNKNCQGREKMPKLPELIREPVKEPVRPKPRPRRCEISPDPETCEQAAKGICWGVIAYWVISETLRIICPPRNLVPIP